MTPIHLPQPLPMLLTVLAAAMLAWIALRLSTGLALPRWGRPQQIERIEHFAAGPRAERTNHTALGSREHRIITAFARYGIEASGWEDRLLLLARVAAAGGMVLILLGIGLPLLTSLTGIAAGLMLVNGTVERAWRRTCTEIESELPSLLLRLNATLQSAPNMPSALEAVAKTLRPDGPLRAWTLEAAARMHSEGHAGLEALRESAAGISVSLSIAADLIGRMWTTGGEGYTRAFGTAADNLESVLDARVLARAKGGSAQGTVNILTAMTFVMIAFMSRSEAMAGIVGSPLVQTLYALICMVIVYGHGQVSSIIDNAV